MKNKNDRKITCPITFVKDKLVEDKDINSIFV
jgi:hypothetical protein